MAPFDYHVGDQAVVEVQWSDPASTTPPIDPETGFTLVNPTTVTLDVWDPDGAKTSPVVSVVGFVYSARIPLTKSGVWVYGFTASGNYTAHDQGALAVQPTRA